MLQGQRERGVRADNEGVMIQELSGAFCSVPVFFSRKNGIVSVVFYYETRKTGGNST